MDCIVKNCPDPYKELFERNILPNFCSAFHAIEDGDVRQAMLKVRSFV
jgi:hypothetical protein